jgi:tripartite-type tricarboxylate transporter receptor subunit TctC
VWNGLFGPKGMPKPAVEKLVAALQTAVQSPAFRARLADLGAEPVPLSKANPGSLGNLLKAEVDKWGPIIRKTGTFAD